MTPEEFSEKLNEIHKKKCESATLEIKTLTKGMKMKLCIAVALSHKPKLLIWTKLPAVLIQ